MKLSERTRVGTCIRRIYEAFLPHNDLSGNKKARFGHKRIAAVDGIKAADASSRTRWLARKYLGIHCQKVAGNHVWVAPTVSLKTALEIAQRHSKSHVYKLKEDRKAREKRYAENIVPMLREAMKNFNYDANPHDIIDLLRQQGVGTRSVIHKARDEAGVVVVRFGGQFHWILPSHEVRSWLVLMLKDGPIDQDKLFKAAHEQGYSDLLINQFRFNHGFKQWYTFDPSENPLGPTEATVYWYDMNTWSPEKEYKE